MTNFEIILIVWNLINTILAEILFLMVVFPGGIKDKMKELKFLNERNNRRIHELELDTITEKAEISKINKEIEHLNRYNALKEDPQLETKEYIIQQLNNIFNKNNNNLNPQNLFNILTDIKREIDFFEQVLTPPKNTPKEQETPNTKTINIKDDPIQKILNTKLKLNKEDTEKLANGMTECMQSLDRIGEAISNAFKDAIDERNKINQNKSNNEIYYKLIEKYGNQQIIVSIEELAELQKELCKHLRDKTNKKAIIEEICDVQIMLEQLILYFDISPLDLDSVKRWKLERTKERMLTDEKE